MAKLDGKWRCTAETPVGTQEFDVTVVTRGDRFSGHAEGSMGTMDIDDGAVEGDTLAWSMRVSKPMPLTLTCSARVDGDLLEGSVTAGIFGSFPVKGVRV